MSGVVTLLKAFPTNGQYLAIKDPPTKGRIKVAKYPAWTFNNPRNLCGTLILLPKVFHQKTVTSGLTKALHTSNVTVKLVSPCKAPWSHVPIGEIGDVPITKRPKRDRELAEVESDVFRNKTSPMVKAKIGINTR